MKDSKNTAKVMQTMFLPTHTSHFQTLKLYGCLHYISDDTGEVTAFLNSGVTPLCWNFLFS